MLAYVPSIVGCAVQYIIVWLHYVIVQKTNDVGFLFALFIVYEIALVIFAAYCLYLYPRFYSYGSRLSNNAVSFCNGLCGGILGILMTYNINNGSIFLVIPGSVLGKNRKGYAYILLGVIYSIAFIGNILTVSRFWS